MKKFAEPIDLNAWDESSHYYIVYCSDNDSLTVCQEIYIGGAIYFNSREAARKCIDEVGEYRIKKYYLGIS